MVAFSGFGSVISGAILLVIELVGYVEDEDEITRF